MSLQTIHNKFIKSLAGIYDNSEAENIWALASEKILSEKFQRHEYAVIIPTELLSTQFDDISQRLLKHEPIQYIIEECWFYDLPFFVDKNVLIPRPETEELVDWVIKENKSAAPLILDVGTGSGCIPIILKRKIPAATVYSCDISEEAIQVAKRNADTHQTTIHFLQTDFLHNEKWADFPEVDIIVSNPPYIPEKDKNEMRLNVVNHEPHLALFVKNNRPLIFYEAIANFGLRKLKPGGAIYVEVHESLAANVTNVFQEKSYTTMLKKDMQRKERMIKAVLTG